MKLKPFTPQRYRRRIFGQLGTLGLQFVLGMALNFVDSDSTGIKHTFYVIILVAHIVTAIGIVEGGIYIALKAPSGLAWRAAITTFVTFGAGVLTVITKQDAWSFVMACGFLAAAALYVLLYVHADRALHLGTQEETK